MSVHDAEPQDLYVDKGGRLWRVVGVWRGDTVVSMQEVESATPDSPVQMHGGARGHMWDGIKRIYRPEPHT